MSSPEDKAAEKLFKEIYRTIEKLSIAVLDGIAEEMLREAKRQLREGIWTDTGAKGVGAMYQETLHKRGRLINYGKQRLEREVVFEAAYVLAIEYGTMDSPYFPPRRPIYVWVRSKSGLGIVDEAEALEITQKIIWYMGTIGRPPRPFFRRAFNMVDDKFDEIAQRRMRIIQ